MKSRLCDGPAAKGLLIVIGPDRSRSNYILKINGSKNVSFLLDPLCLHCACITWVGSKFRCTKQVTKGGPTLIFIILLWSLCCTLQIPLALAKPSFSRKEISYRHLKHINFDGVCKDIINSALMESDTLSLDDLIGQYNTKLTSYTQWPRFH